MIISCSLPEGCPDVFVPDYSAPSLPWFTETLSGMFYIEHIGETADIVQKPIASAIMTLFCSSAVPGYSEDVGATL